MPEHRATKKLKPPCSFFTFSFDAKLVCSVIERLLKEIFKMIITDILEKFLASQQESFSALIQVASYVALATLKLIKKISIQITSNSLVVFNSVILGRLSHVFLM